MTTPSHPKKLIEVALPLDDINAASALEKQPFTRRHPRSMHIWWARRPFVAARAVIFSQMVDDPSTYVDELLADPQTRRKAEQVHKTRLQRWTARNAEIERGRLAGAENLPEPGPQPDLADVAAELERERLFTLIRALVLWQNTTNEEVLNQARAEIRRSWQRTCAAHADHPQAATLFNPDKLPAFHDPFAGGGALPLEAQRLGLEAYASDLNPVAVLINKAMIEIPPKFAGMRPVNPAVRSERRTVARQWRGAQGLAEDVRYYGQWMRDRAEERIGALYPKVKVTPEMVAERPDLKPYKGRELTVIAWLWVRTVKSPNPAFAHVDVPLASTFMLSTKTGKEAYVEPVIAGDGYRFTVKVGKPKDADAAKNGTKSGGSRTSFLCFLSDTPMSFDYLRDEAKAGRMGARLMAIVAEGDRGRVYLSPTPEMEAIALGAQPNDVPETELPKRALGFRVQEYGMTRWRDLFTPRQLVALTTFSDLVQEARAQVYADAVAAGLPADGPGLDTGGRGAQAYADAVGVYLGLAIDKASDYNSSLVVWSPTRDQAKTTFARQALPMVWDYCEINFFAGAAGDVSVSLDGITRFIDSLHVAGKGYVNQQDAQNQDLTTHKMVSTDPPYFDNIGYADLSDFFYVWLRRSLRPVFPNLFATMAVPKAEELVATPYRHGSKIEAEAFFLGGMTQAMERLAQQGHPGFPVTIYYAFKQAETQSNGTASTGWETFLDAVIRAGFAVSGTWPMRTELSNRMIGSGTNALASSIVLVCRRRADDAPTATRREFVAALKAELPVALAHLQAGNIAPVDLAQSAIGPGMAVFTRFSRVLDASGRPMAVREALALINQVLDETLAEQEGDFDADTRWALAWFEQSGFDAGDYGVAETLSKAKNTSVAGMMDAGILKSAKGKVQLLRPRQLPADWDPARDKRFTTWEAVHHLIRVMETGGEEGAAALAAALGSQAEVARELAYRLYTICERKKRAAEALAYNSLVQSWPEIGRLAQTVGKTEVQLGMEF